MSGQQDKSAGLSGRDIRKTFHRDTGELVVALDQVSIEARPGRLTALVGPDGAGKTTLIRLATGLLKRDSGQLSVLGIDVQADPQQVQTRIGYMPQRFGLYEDLTVQENLDLYADLHGVLARERTERYAAHGDDGPRAVYESSCRPIVGRNETEAGTRLHADPLPRAVAA